MVDLQEVEGNGLPLVWGWAVGIRKWGILATPTGVCHRTGRVWLHLPVLLGPNIVQAIVSQGAIAVGR